MCRRTCLSLDFSQLKIRVSIPDEVPAANFAPNWNLAPTQRMAIVRLDAEPNGEMAPIHDRMPVILPETAWPLWLGKTDALVEAAAELLVPYSEHLVMWRVDKTVGSVKNNHEGLIGAIGP